MFEIRPLNEDERKYTYTQSVQIAGQTCNIGFWRGKLFTPGYELSATWNDCKELWKTQEFNNEFDKVVEALRSDEYGILKDVLTMEEYIDKFPDSAFQGIDCTEYGFRVDTDKHAYLLRCNPLPGDYNFSVFCYVAKWLDRHLERSRRGIQFVDATGANLFCLKDGEKIVVTTGAGENKEFTCRFIDETHLEVGGDLLHINQFAEIMNRNGNVYKPKLPEEKIVVQQGDISGEKKNRGHSHKVR